MCSAHRHRRFRARFGSANDNIKLPCARRIAIAQSCAHIATQALARTHTRTHARTKPGNAAEQLCPRVWRGRGGVGHLAAVGVEAGREDGQALLLREEDVWVGGGREGGGGGYLGGFAGSAACVRA